MQRRVTVIGGGLAGLTAAATAARAGAAVTVHEARDTIGGRARTREDSGFLLNEGAHALYANGAGAYVLRNLGIQPRGGTPPTSGAFVSTVAGSNSSTHCWELPSRPVRRS